MKVLISGGGIAGLTLAYWLQKAGVTPVVVEQANGMRHNGYGVDFYSTGYDVAERMQLVDQLRPHQIRAQYLAYLNEQGKPAAKLALDTMRQVLGGKYMALMHYTLEDVLYDAVCAQVEVRFNTTISALEQSADAVIATFSDGQSETFALVVGADGIHSNVRNLVFGPEADFARYMGYYTAAYKVPAHYTVDDAWLNYSEPGRQVGVYPSEKAGELVTLFIYKAADESYIPHAQRLAKLKSVYAGMGWITDQLLADIQDPDDIFMDTVTQIVMPKWSNGRIVLVGDACGCMTLVSGQGVSMAMGGAYILAEELAQNEDYERAFLNYEHRLRPEIELRQRKAHDFAKTFVPDSKFGLKTQQVVMSILFHDIFSGLLKTQFLGDSILRAERLTRLPASSGNVIGYKVAGKLSDSDYATFTLDIEHELARSESIRLLLQMGDLAGIELKAIWDDFQFGVAHGRDIAKLALVGDQRWAKWVATFAQPFYAQRVRHFVNEELDQAWRWLRSAEDDTK